jgi:hypothetical protein
MSAESAIRQELATVEGYLARLTEQTHAVEGQRDQLVLKLTDLEGAASNRFAGVR